jgi:malonyl-CoA/methylmalonyl-CoA synthetase
VTNHLFSSLFPTGRDNSSACLIHADGGLLAYGEVEAGSARYAAALASLALTRGNRVLVQIDKSPVALFLYLACIRSGAAFVPLNVAYTRNEVEYFIRDADPALIVCRPADAEALRAIAGGAQVETLGRDGTGSLASLAARQSGSWQDIACGPDDLAAILYTSGTTGRSKGAMLSHGNLRSNAEALARAWKFSAADCLIHALPIFHVHGLFVAINVALVAGASMIFLPKFDVDEVLGWIPRASVMMGVPTFYSRLLSRPQLTDALAAKMRLFISGSAPLLAETHRSFLDRTGHAILERYGMTETGMNTSNPYGARMPGSVGRPLEGVEVRLRDVATGGEAEVGVTGMIEVRGPNVFSGYWRMPKKTRAEFREDGFFITGDLGKIDARGYVWIVGRDKDLIISGGYNVYPREVELEIDAFPGVSESAVIGLPHPDLGEAVTALIVRDGDIEVEESALLEHLRGRLAKFKLPKRIIFVEELPRNAMAKVQKSVLRDQYRGSFD